MYRCLSRPGAWSVNTKVAHARPLQCPFSFRHLAFYAYPPPTSSSGMARRQSYGMLTRVLLSYPTSASASTILPHTLGEGGGQ